MRKSGIILLSTILLTACTIQAPQELLIRTDSIMQTHPDSALHLLENIPLKSLKTKADIAYYALLLTQARDKNYILQTDDSLIQIAADYYDTQKNATMQARAYYLWGSIYRDMNRCGIAIKKYYQAATYAKKVNENVLLGRIYNNLGALYYSQSINCKADSIYLLAEQLAIQQNDSNLLAETLAQRGRITMENSAENYKKAEQMLLDALNIVHSLKNRGIEANISAHLSTLYSWMGLGEESLKYAKRNLSLIEDTLHKARGLMLLGNAYFKTKQYDSATVFLKQSLRAMDYEIKDYGIKVDVCMRLAAIARAQENTNETIKYERLYSAYIDSMHLSKQDLDIISTEKQVQVEEKNLSVHSLRDELNFFIIGTFFIISILGYTIWKYNRKVQKSKLLRSKSESRYLHTRQQLEEKRKENLSLQQKIELLNAENAQKESLEKDLDKLMNKRTMLMQEEYEFSQVYLKMKKIIQEYQAQDKSELQLVEEDWHQLIAVTDARWSNITLRLREKYSLTQEDVYICCLYLTEFPTSHLQYILGCSRDSVYRKGYHILENKMGLSRKSTSLKEHLKSF